MKRITMDDSLKDAIIKLSDGNPGALTVLASLYERHGIEAMVYMCWLDDLEIYGSGIWVAFKDECGEDLNVLTHKLRNHRRELKDAVLRVIGA